MPPKPLVSRDVATAGGGKTEPKGYCQLQETQTIGSKNSSRQMGGKKLKGLFTATETMIK